MKHFRWITGIFLAVFIATGAWIWFSPFGTGEYAESPNGRYCAWATNFRRGTWLHGRVDYIEIQVIENAKGRVVWSAQRYPLAGERPPEFGDRSKRFIRWAPDSRSVAVPVGGPSDAVWVVP